MEESKQNLEQKEKMRKSVEEMQENEELIIFMGTDWKVVHRETEKKRKHENENEMKMKLVK